jgi:mannonate dehydratase
MRRRDFVKLPAAAWSARLARAIDEDDPNNIKIAHRLSARITDDDLLFLKQIGLRWARVEFGNGPVTFDSLRETRQRFARFGMKIYSGVHYAYRSPVVQLGQPGRDKLIEEYCTFLRDLGRLEIPVASYDFHPANTYTTAMVERRGYTAREFDLADFRAKVEKRMFDREYSADRMWSNYTYFIKAVLPAAAEARVKLALHPDDPPVAKMNGVAKLFVNYEGYHRAEQIAAGSPWWGLTLCCGTWIEGGAPLPDFVETFPDDGYVDMYEIMKTLRSVRYAGAAEPDHVPKLTGDTGIQRAGTAYCIAYMRSLLRRANSEVG